MKYKSQIFILFLLINASFLLAQKDEIQSGESFKKDETVITKVIDCNALYTLNDRKVDYLRKRSYVYAEPYYERAFNSKRDYAVFQIGKRRGTTPFLYVRIYSISNVCIKEDEVLEFILEDGFKYRMKNIYGPNCDGFIVSKIRNKDIKKLTGSNIKSIKVLTFEKDYDFNLEEDETERMNDELKCLKYNNFKFK